jgi:rhomboid protease GluP
MWALFQAGQLLEKLLGRSLFVLVYFGSGLTGSLVTLLWHGDKMWSAGASGAVFGVYGALIGYMLREKHALPKSVYQPGLKSALTFAGYNLFYGMVHPRIDNAAHLGGLLGGLALGWLVAVPVDLPSRLRLIPQRLRLGAALLAVAIVAGVVAAPRYPYRLSEELAWSAAVKAPVARETDILRHQESALNTFQAGKPNPELARWLTHEGLPFAESWLKTMEDLPLTPGRTTATRRAAFVKILRLRLDAYRHLLVGVEKSDPLARDNFRTEERALKAEITQFAARR